MDTETRIKTLESKINELENKLLSLFSVSTFPLDLENTLIQRGFQNVGEKELSLYYSGGVSGKTFKENYRQVKYRNRNELITFREGIKIFTVNTTTNVCSSNNHGFIDGQYITFRTTDTLPSGLDSLSDTYWVLNSTQDTFQVTIDGINAVDITSTGSGEQYAFIY